MDFEASFFGLKFSIGWVNNMTPTFYVLAVSLAKFLLILES